MKKRARGQSSRNASRLNARAAPPALFAQWEHVARRIRRASRILLFLDFDGTLVRFHRDPESVRLDDSLRKLLESLSRNPRIDLVFISGRRRQDLRRRTAVAGARYIGLHGMETAHGMGISAASRRRIARIYRQVEAAVRGLSGIWVEDKLASVVLHFRGAPRAAESAAQARVRRILSVETAPPRILRGKRIWELLAPEVRGKGAAAAALVRTSERGALPIYFGDDTTDESAFAALNGGAVTVRVGRNSETRARYHVRSPEDVREFLRRLAELV